MRYFVCSDIHSYYSPWMKALDEAGFNENDFNHKIILCGDLFDRADESQRVYRFVKEMIQKDKLIYVKGNHEQLLIDCCKRGYPQSHDYHNGTVRTVWDLGVANPIDPYDFEECAKLTEVRVKGLLKHSVNYYETEHHIFVHSWIPVISKDDLPAHYTRNRQIEYNPDWRNANQEDWDAATWGNPFVMAEAGLNQTGKTIVFGHWSTEYKWASDENRQQFNENFKHDIYYGDGYIGLDATTAYSKKVNVLVIEDDVSKQ